VFFLGGQLGLSAGPILAGVMLDRAGVAGIYVLAIVFLPVPLAMAVAMRGAPAPERHHPRPRSGPSDRQPGIYRVLALLVVIFSARSWIFIGTVAFLPLLFFEKGWSATGQGLVAGVFWLGGALAGVAAGRCADRYGRRLVVSASALFGGLALLFLPAADGAAALLLALGCGALLGAPHSILIVVAQDLLPVGRALASGLSLGFLFAMGAVSSWAIGTLADRFGLETVLRAGLVPALVVAGLALALPPSARIRSVRAPGDAIASATASSATASSATASSATFHSGT
jgi:FSR family fosmidomycin resistance protein-like MFS transporter